MNRNKQDLNSVSSFVHLVFRFCSFFEWDTLRPYLRQSIGKATDKMYYNDAAPCLTTWIAFKCLWRKKNNCFFVERVTKAKKNGVFLRFSISFFGFNMKIRKVMTSEVVTPKQHNTQSIISLEALKQCFLNLAAEMNFLKGLEREWGVSFLNVEHSEECYLLQFLNSKTYYQESFGCIYPSLSLCPKAPITASYVVAFIPHVNSILISTSLSLDSLLVTFTEVLLLRYYYHYH